VSKTKVSEMALKSFSEAAEVDKKAKILGKNFSSVTVKYHFLLQTPSVLLLKITFCLFNQYSLRKDPAFSLSLLRKNWIMVITT